MLQNVLIHLHENPAKEDQQNPAFLGQVMEALISLDADPHTDPFLERLKMFLILEDKM